MHLRTGLVSLILMEKLGLNNLMVAEEVEYKCCIQAHAMFSLIEFCFYMINHSMISAGKTFL